MSKNKERPVFLSLTKVRVPITAYVSFAHRVTGVLLFIFIAFIMYAFSMSLESEESFNQLKTMLSIWYVRLFTWGGLSILFYHLFAGIKHLMMDFGIGESLKGGVLLAKGVIALSVITSLGLGFYFL